MIKVIATDLDGTLLQPKRPYRLVSSKNIKVLRNFVKKGGHVILVSSRSYSFCKLIAAKLKINCSIVACSGSIVETNGEFIQAISIDQNIIKNIIKDVSSINKHPGFVITSQAHKQLAKLVKINFLHRLLIKLYHFKIGKYFECLDYKKDHFDQYLEDPKNLIFRLYILLLPFLKSKPQQTAALLKDKYEDAVDVRVMNSGIEIAPNNIDKATAVKLILDKIDVSTKETLVVGDDLNDLPLFDNFENSVAMANGHEEVKEKAKVVIKKYKYLAEILNDKYN